MSTELTRLSSGPDFGEQPKGLIAALTVHCDSDALGVLTRAKQVLGLVLQQGDPATLSMEQWHEILPSWFVRQCADEITQAEAERRRSLPYEQRVELAKHWSLGGWLYWFGLKERPWEWWNAKVIVDTCFSVDLVVPGFPYPSGAIEWLLQCSGAKDIERMD